MRAEHGKFYVAMSIYIYIHLYMSVSRYIYIYRYISLHMFPSKSGLLKLTPAQNQSGASWLAMLLAIAALSCVASGTVTGDCEGEGHVAWRPARGGASASTGGGCQNQWYHFG